MSISDSDAEFFSSPHERQFDARFEATLQAIVSKTKRSVGNTPHLKSLTVAHYAGQAARSSEVEEHARSELQTAELVLTLSNAEAERTTDDPELMATSLALLSVAESDRDCAKQRLDMAIDDRKIEYMKLVLFANTLAE